MLTSAHAALRSADWRAQALPPIGVLAAAGSLLLFVGLGCSRQQPTSNSRPSAATSRPRPTNPSTQTQQPAPAQAPADAPHPQGDIHPDEAPAPLPTIRLGPASAPRSLPTDAADADAPSGDASGRTAVIAALQPLQSLLGAWRSTTQRDVGDFKALDQPEWLWDLRTDRARPALVMTAREGVYYREMRITWLGEPGVFRLTMTDKDGATRQFDGQFSEPVEEFQQAGTKIQKKFKLQFDEHASAEDRPPWRIVLNVQHNDRFLLELTRLQGSGPFRFDTVAHQREGTSIAQDDDDYGERKCIISGGLGTIAVSYQGRSYWVCCTGCQAAFEEDPESWLKDAAAKVAAPP